MAVCGNVFFILLLGEIVISFYFSGSYNLIWVKVNGVNLGYMKFYSIDFLFCANLFAACGRSPPLFFELFAFWLPKSVVWCAWQCCIEIRGDNEEKLT
jgi:hypothetical protein